MDQAETELEELLHALESLERKMTVMQYRVARLKHETRTIRPASTPTDTGNTEKVRLRSAADRLRRFGARKPGAKQTLH